jgi:hypothetical protein
MRIVPNAQGHPGLLTGDNPALVREQGDFNMVDP